MLNRFASSVCGLRCSGVPMGSPSCGGDVAVYVKDINQPSLPIPFCSALVSVSVFMALSTVFHSINSPNNSLLSHSVLPVFFALLVFSSVYLSMKVFFNPDIILCSWMGLNHKLTNSLSVCLFVCLRFSLPLSLSYGLRGEIILCGRRFETARCFGKIRRVQPLRWCGKQQIGNSIWRLLGGFIKRPIHFLIQSWDLISCCGKPVKRTNEIGLELFSLVRSTDFPQQLIGSHD